LIGAIALLLSSFFLRGPIERFKTDLPYQFNELRFFLFRFRRNDLDRL
jgi:hypothetical protein